jgi:peptidyl-dipeptidase Dcp
MPKNSDGVYKLLKQLIESYKPTALKEFLEVEQLAKKEQGEDFQLQFWDWTYYSNKLKEQKFKFTEEMLKPYFELNQAKSGIFGLATKLYGKPFKQILIPVYQPDVESFEVLDKNDEFFAILYLDFHPRN